MTSDIDRIRLAVVCFTIPFALLSLNPTVDEFHQALSVLKYKPVEQSFSAYVLDLRTLLSCPSIKSSSGELWRGFALKIERDYIILKERYDRERTKSLSSRDALATRKPVPIANHLEPAAAKKKGRKKENQLNSVSAADNLKFILEELTASHSVVLPRISPSHSLLSYLDEYVQLISLPRTSQELVSSTTFRLIDSIAQLIGNLVHHSTRGTSADGRTLKHFAGVLYHVLSSAFPSLVALKSEEINTTLLRKITYILTPLIHAFTPRSEAYLRSILLPNSNSNSDNATTVGINMDLEPLDDTPEYRPATDICTEMLTLFRIIFRLVNEQCLSCSTWPGLYLECRTLQASLILETVREIEQLLLGAPEPTDYGSSDPGCGGGIDADQRHRVRRAKKLAVKETLWYLCAVLNILLDKCPGAGCADVQLGSNPTRAQQPWDGSSRPGKGQSKVEIERTNIVQDQQRLLNKAISGAFFRLVARCKQPASKYSRHQVYTRFENGGGSQSDIDTRDRSAVNLTNGENYSRGDLGQSCVARGVAEVSDIGSRDVSRDDHDHHDGKAIDVGVDGVGRYLIGAAGQGDGDHTATALPQGACELGDKEIHSEKTSIELDDAGYGMLLGILERYWLWSTF